ncbi:MAG: 4Fe-4S binding protein [Ignavibacteriales bacterium]|nr:4Fe-4S binding protein [Ignavibacteriales bacterium]
MLRKIIKIDEELCDGCGNCITSCHEGALQIINGKAKVVKESFCDGLGACIGECPLNALSIVETDADSFDEAAVQTHLQQIKRQNANQNIDTRKHTPHGGGGCPSSRVMSFEKVGNEKSYNEIPSQLRQWPIQLHLVPPNAPYFMNADIALVADCVPFSYGNFHNDFLTKFPIAIGCPKLDNGQAYIEKLSKIIQQSRPKSFKVVVMEVPCCSGLLQIAQQAVHSSGFNIPVEVTVIGIRGDILIEKTIL